MSSVNLQAMVQHVFSEPPKDPKSYLLDLQIKSEDYPDKTEAELAEMEASNIAQLLMGIFSYGCSVLYKSVLARDMTKEQFSEVNRYMESFGYTTKYDYVYEERGEQGRVATNLNVWFEKLN
jgi:hypothetical protein